MPAALCALFLALAWRPWNGREIASRAGFWGGALGLAAAYIGVHLFVAGVPELPPSDDLDWLVYIAPVAAVVGVLERRLYSGRITTLLVRAVVVTATYWLTLDFMIEHHWDEATSMWAVGALSIVTLEAIVIFDKMADRRRGALVPLAMTLLAAGAAVTLGLIGTARVAQLMGGLAAASGALLVLAWWRPLVRTSRGPITVYFVLFGGLLAFGYLSTVDWPGWSGVTDHYPTLAVLLLAGAPLALLIADADFTNEWAGWKRTLLGAAIIALPVAGSIYAGTLEQEEEEEAEELDDVDYDGLYE